MARRDPVHLFDLLMRQEAPLLNGSIVKHQGHFLNVYAGGDAIASLIAMLGNVKEQACLGFYKFNADSEAGRAFIQVMRELSARAEAEQRPIHIQMFVNARGSVANALYSLVTLSKKKAIDEDLASLPKEVNNEFFTLEVGLHKAGAFNTYHAKYAVIDGVYLWLASTDLQKPADKQRQQYETAIAIQSRALCERMLGDISERWTRHGGRPHPYVLLPEPHTEDQPEPMMLLLKDTANLTTKKLAPVKYLLLQSIGLARHRIDIVSPNFNDETLIQAIAEAIVERGVTVNISMGKHHNDGAERLAGGINYDMMKRLYQMIGENNRHLLHVHWACNPETGDIVQHGERYAIHAKFAMIDDEVLLMGSSPLDRQGLVCSYEVDTVKGLSQREAQHIKGVVLDPLEARTRQYFVDEVIESFSQYPGGHDFTNLINVLKEPGIPLAEALSIVDIYMKKPDAALDEQATRFVVEILDEYGIIAPQWEITAVDPDRVERLIVEARELDAEVAVILQMEVEQQEVVANAGKDEGEESSLTP